MDILALIQQIILYVVLPAISLVVVPYLAAKIAAYIKARGDLAKQQKDLGRMQEIDHIAESALNMMRLNNPKLSILDNIDRVKDDLVAAILADATVPVKADKGEIAARVAGNAVYYAARNELMEIPMKAKG